ncbi:ComEC/Rec2 family competence protein [Candidatus Poribacteria bacterium]|nr:ComEC/Rec2 family competence protein [Candidatus Poribacteria bacterium]
MTFKPRPALFFLIPFILGIIIGGYTSFPLLWVWVSILILLMGCIFTRKRSKYICYTLLHIAVFACGMLRLDVATVPSIPDNFYEQPVSFTGQTVYQPERGESWDACYAIGKIQLLTDPTKSVSAKCLIRFQDVVSLRYGKHLSVTGVLQQPQSKRNPGGFDYRAYLERQNVSGVIQHQGILQIGKQGGFLPLRWIESLRFRTEQIIDDAYSKQNPSPNNEVSLHAQLLKGILLGKRGDVPRETLDMFRNSGTFHVLAVSGLHVGLIALFCYLGLSIFRIPNKFVCLFTIFAVILYASLVGFRPSVFRASLMTILFLFATIIDRDADIYNLLSVAALVLLLINPTQLWDVGFQLSFVAVAAIVFFVSKMEKPFRKFWETDESVKNTRFEKMGRSAVKWLVLSYLVTLAAQIGTSPLIAYHFYRTYPLGIIVGPFAVGLVSLIVGVGMASVCMGFIWLPLAKLVGIVNQIIMHIFLNLISLFGQDWGIVKIAPPTMGLILIYIVICVGITQWRYLYKQWRIASLIGLSILTIWVWDIGFNEEGRLLEVITLDVGQGDAAVIKFPDKQVMLVDGGIQHAYYDEKKKRKVDYDVGKRIIEPYLDSENIRNIDMVMLTHPDLDHGGGLGYILQNYQVGQLVGIPDMELDSTTHNRLRNIAISQKTTLLLSVCWEHRIHAFCYTFVTPPNKCRWDKSYG